MPSLSGDAPMGKVASLAAHSIPYLLPVAIVIRLGHYFGLGMAGLDILFTFAALAAMIFLGIHVIKGGLCLRCMNSSPDDPESEIQGWRKWFLWETHWTRRQVLWTYGLAFLCSLVGAVLFQFRSLPDFLCSVPIDVLFFSNIWSVWTHHRLEPWCPYCQGWDEGGEPELVPDPDPAEGAKR